MPLTHTAKDLDELARYAESLVDRTERHDDESGRETLSMYIPIDDQETTIRAGTDLPPWAYIVGVDVILDGTVLVVMVQDRRDDPESLESLLSRGLTAPEAVDYWAVDVKGYTQTAWGPHRGVDQSTVSANAEKARGKLGQQIIDWIRDAYHDTRNHGRDLVKVGLPDAEYRQLRAYLEQGAADANTDIRGGAVYVYGVAVVEHECRDVLATEP